MEEKSYAEVGREEGVTGQTIRSSVLRATSMIKRLECEGGFVQMRNDGSLWVVVQVE
jgi:hypothetical protein